MKKRDYDLIAKIIRSFPKGATRADVCKRFVNALMEDSTGFNSEQFITDCGL